MDNPELDSLLSQKRLSFHWNAAGKTWFLVGQIKGGNSLHTTPREPAEDLKTAQAAAVQFIQEHFAR